MNPPELEKLRRFCLTIALILITYVASGTKIDTLHSASVLGLPLTITRPHLILLGLVLMSVCSVARYWYYGFLHVRSPRKHRKKFMARFHKTKEPEMYRLAPVAVEDYEALRSELPSVFPELRKHGAALTHSSVEHSAAGRYVKDAVLYVPRRVQRAAWFEDIDYSAAIWLNLVALPLAIIQIIHDWRN
jgi:hypothetical protein